MLFVYAAGFSFAYITLSSGIGALILFASVQLTMIGYGLMHGERFNRLQFFGLILAVLGLIWLYAPGVDAPPIIGSLLMALAGITWGAYSLLGRQSKKPLQDTAGNFIRSVPMVLVVVIISIPSLSLDWYGVILGVISGAVTSGLGYALWYKVLPFLQSKQASTIQLSVPVIAGIGGLLFIGEPLTLRFVLASALILLGIYLTLK